MPLLFKKAEKNEKFQNYKWTGLKKIMIINGVLWTTPFNAACYLLSKQFKFIEKFLKQICGRCHL